MRKRRSRRKLGTAAERSGRRRVLALVLILGLVSAGAILGQRFGAFSQASPKKPAPSQPDAAITPASFDSPSKEYIYAGGKLLATEEPQGGGGPPAHHASTIGLFRPNGNFFYLTGQVTGWVFSADGTRFRIAGGSSGRCTKIIDRNGNILDILYDTPNFGDVTYFDQLKREVVLQGGTGGATVTIKGYNGLPDRVYTIGTGQIGATDSSGNPN